MNKIISAVVLLGFLSLALTPRASAQMTLTITETDGDTTIAYSGSWDSFGEGTEILSVPLDAYVQPGPAFYKLTPGILKSDGEGVHINATSPWAWGFYYATSSTGDYFGFERGYRYAAPGYVSGALIEGSLIYEGSTLMDFGITESSGSILMVNGFAPITWTAGVTAVPEPSTYAAIFGACALGFVAFRRNRFKRAA